MKNTQAICGWSDGYNASPNAIPSVFGNANLDVIDNHKYGRDKKINYQWRFGRFNTLRGYYSHPYIMGEMGTDGDAPGDPPHLPLDNLCDRPFHDAIWSTAFMGGFGAGLEYWAWDFDAYRINLWQVSSFMNNIDFEANKWHPEKWKNSGLFGLNGLFYTLENYELANLSATRAMGWVHNATANWEHVLACRSNTHTLDPAGHDPYSWLVNIPHNSKFKVKALDWFRQYKVELYRPESNTLYDSWYQSSMIGYMKIKCHDMFDWREDYTYKIYESLFPFRIREDASLYYDTLDCSEDTLFIDGVYEDDSLSILTYNWLVDNSTTYSGNHPAIATSFGDHVIQVIISNSTNQNLDTIIFHVSRFSCEEEKIRNEEEYINNVKDYIQVYPNPSHEKFTVDIGIEFENASLRIIDLYGRIIKTYKLENSKLDLNGLPKGTYNLRFEIDGISYSKLLILE